MLLSLQISAPRHDYLLGTFLVSLGAPEKGAHRLNLAGGVNSLGTTIGPIVVALILFGTTHKSGSELNAMITNGEISLSTIQMLYLARNFSF